MLNYDKHKEEIDKIFKDGKSLCEISQTILKVHCLGCNSDKEKYANCKIKTLEWLCQEYKEPIKPILTEKEKIIINNILKAIEPFGAEVQCIAKYRQGDEPTDYYLNFSYKNSTDSFDTFTFNGNELFVGMEVDELYTLEELGLC